MQTQEPATPAVSYRTSSLWRRLAGLVYDLVAVVAIVMVVGMICLIATHGSLVPDSHHGVTAWWYSPLQYLVVAAYFVVSWLRGGQTLGMRPWRMVLRMSDGTPVRPGPAIARVVAVSLPMLLLSIGHVASPRTAMLAVLAAWVVFYATALVNPRRRALHDLIAGTQLIHKVVPRNKTAKHASRHDSRHR
ncbi:MAG TPA: RDD family protein [Oleiagrimonas sp.]|nr:RDD family protein [Oleiagrimonas sp.]